MPGDARPADSGVARAGSSDPRGRIASGLNLVTQELGFANLAMGLGAIVATFLGGALAAAITGGLKVQRV